MSYKIIKISSIFFQELAAAKFLSDIEQPDIVVKRKALDELAGTVGQGQAEDPMFAKEFLSRSGVNALVRLIESAAEYVAINL